VAVIRKVITFALDKVDMIKRALYPTLYDRLLNSQQVVLLFGPRQVGKTTLVQDIFATLPGKKLEINADLMPYAEVLSSRELSKLQGLVAGYDYLFIDEAQRIPEIGINLKILHDQIPQLRIIATGSSSLDLASKTREPLTGRTWTHQLFPIGMSELASSHNRFELDALLDEYLIFGGYPGVLNRSNYTDKRNYLVELTSAYLYKDVLELMSIKNPAKMRDLLRLLAYQIGSEVSLNELSNTLKIHRDTVVNYMDLLEKAFVIFRLSGYSRNLRKEISRHDKVFFWDLGVRNALIGNFSPLSGRDDTGRLWENFLLTEHIKTQTYRQIHANRFFWRTYTGAELDYVEERDGQLYGYEFKWGKKNSKAPATWRDVYPNAVFQVVNRDNYLDFLL
jgi:uncharacterized protein